MEVVIGALLLVVVIQALVIAAMAGRASDRGQRETAIIAMARDSNTHRMLREDRSDDARFGPRPISRIVRDPPPRRGEPSGDGMDLLKKNTRSIMGGIMAEDIPDGVDIGDVPLVPPRKDQPED